MIRALRLVLIALLLPACALSFEPYGLDPGDAAPSTDRGSAQDADGGGAQDADPTDLAAIDGTEPDLDGGPDDLGPAPDRGVDRPDVGPRVSVTLIAAGSNDAWFHSEPPGLDCQGTGSFEVPVGSAWSVTASPGADRVFTEWSQGPCSTSTASVCRFTVDTSVTLKADFDRP